MSPAKRARFTMFPSNEHVAFCHMQFAKFFATIYRAQLLVTIVSPLHVCNTVSRSFNFPLRTLPIYINSDDRVGVSHSEAVAFCGGVWLFEKKFYASSI